MHACQQSFSSGLDSDYIDLLNCVQRHTRCSTAYFLRKKAGSNDLECGFKFPLPCHNETTLEFEEIHTKNGLASYRVKLVRKRNGPRSNSDQTLQLQGWRTNCDIQIIIDYAMLQKVKQNHHD